MFDTEPFPLNYKYRDKIYPIRTDFREWIKFELLMLDPDIPQQDKTDTMLHLAFDNLPQDPKLYDFLIYFYSGGRKPVTVKSKKPSVKKSAAIYSFEYDDGYIYAAFMEQYGIDLLTVDYMHWWQFKALFKALHDCTFTKIMGYRAEELDSKASAKQKARLTELKQIYALPRSLSEQQKIDEAKRIMEQYRH